MLELIELRIELGDHRQVPIDDAIEHRVREPRDALAEHARRVVELGADVVGDQAVAVVRDEPGRADEHIDLDELELVLLRRADAVHHYI